MGQPWLHDTCWIELYCLGPGVGISNGLIQATQVFVFDHERVHDCIPTLDYRLVQRLYPNLDVGVPVFEPAPLLHQNCAFLSRMLAPGRLVQVESPVHVHRLSHSKGSEHADAS